MENACCKNFMKIDLERNRITAAGQSFSAALLLMVVFLLFPVQSLAANKVFEREYTYSASEADSKLTCRVIALEQVKRLLLEELGTYLHSISEVKDGVLTKDEIVSLTAGVVRSEIISEHWDGNVYRLKARIKADPDYVIKAINLLRKDRQKSKELKDSQARAKQYLNEIERLKQELTKTKGEALKRKQIEYSQAVKNLSAEDWFEKGYSFHISNQYEEAIMAYTRVLNINPRFVKAYNNRGLAWADKGNYDRAITDFNSVLEINPRYAIAYYNRGNVWNDKGNLDRAIADYNKALEIDPCDAEAYNNRGNAWSRKGNYDRAIADYTRALDIDPRYAAAYYNRGFAWARKGDNDRAIADYTRVLDIDPRYAAAYNNRGVSWAVKGDLKRALADARKSLSLKPNDEMYQKFVDLLKADIRDKR
jgi:tetratricopeptide (TPR) repeat protein